MKIESSQVQMQAKSLNVLRCSQTVESSFSIELKKFQLSDEGGDDIEEKQVINSSSVSNECDLDEQPVHNSLHRFIISLLLERYLLRSNKELKLHPLDNYIDRRVMADRNISQINSEKIEFEAVYTKFTQEKSINYHKKDEIDFKAKAIIKTKERDIDIDLNILFSKEFNESHTEKLEFEALLFKDPLIIHYDLDSNAFDNIGETTFLFDLDSDGSGEEIPLLKKGSGFLALDKNGNNKIDDGCELFGPKTDDGFLELCEYDLDDNNWIDENDDVFKDLKIWAIDESGNNSLMTLEDADVGAICLENAAAEFNYNISANQTSARLKSASLFLSESSGKAGIVSSVDFA